MVFSSPQSSRGQISFFYSFITMQPQQFDEVTPLRRITLHEQKLWTRNYSVQYEVSEFITMCNSQ